MSFHIIQMRKAIRQELGRGFIPVTNLRSPVDIGDVLDNRRRAIERYDHSQLGISENDIQVGPIRNFASATSGEVSVIPKLSGQVTGIEGFLDVEAGYHVKIQRDRTAYFLLRGIRELSLKNWETARKRLLDDFAKGSLRARVYFVRGLVKVDYAVVAAALKASGDTGLALKISILGSGDKKLPLLNGSVDFGINVAWQRDLSFFDEVPEGGVLGYRVSAIRLKRHRRSSELQDKILKSREDEADVLDGLPDEHRKQLVSEDAVEIVDCTDEVCSRMDEDELA